MSVARHMMAPMMEDSLSIIEEEMEQLEVSTGEMRNILRDILRDIDNIVNNGEDSDDVREMLW